MEGADLQVARLLHTEKAIIRACNLAGAPTDNLDALSSYKHSFTLLQKSAMEGLLLQMFVFILVANFS
jgi:hypothetical protein